MLVPSSDSITGTRYLYQDLRERLFYHFLTNGIKTDDELDFFLQTYCHYKVPRNACCEHHVSPFSFVADQYFDRHKTVLGFANRTGGKTLDVALLNVVECLTKPGIEIVDSGAVREQADRGYDYVVQAINKEPLIASQIVSSLRSETLFANGSVLQIVTGSYTGMNSPHPNKVRIDEVELMHWLVLQEGMQMSVTKNGWSAGDCYTSTRKIAAGTMQKLLNTAEEKQIQVYAWCVWEVLKPCTRLCHDDPVYGNCPAYSRMDKEGNERPMCGGKAHDLKPGGYYEIEDFVAKVRLLDLETFEAQWLNLKPTGGALVYGACFKDESPFVVPTLEAEFLMKRAKVEKWERILAIDFGSNFYCGYYMHDPVTGIWYQYCEYWYSSDSDLALRTHAKNIKEKDPLGFNTIAWVFADPSGRQAIRDLEDEDIVATGANNDLYAGINRVKYLFQQRYEGKPLLRVFHSCGRIRKELSELYSHKVGKDGEPIKDVVVKKDDHGADSLRYSILSYDTVGISSYRSSTTEGV